MMNRIFIFFVIWGALFAYAQEPPVYLSNGSVKYVYSTPQDSYSVGIYYWNFK